MPNIRAKKHAMNANAGVGFSAITGRYVVLSHAATAAPVDFFSSVWSPLGECRPPRFRGRDAAFWVEALITRLAGGRVCHCGLLLRSGKCGRGFCHHRLRTTRSVMRPCESKRCTSEAAAIADDPETPLATFDVEVVGRADTDRDEIRHGDLQSLFMIANKRS
jgi:hypothetical protein